MKEKQEPRIEEKIEQAGKRVHLLLYDGERENDSQYTEWRADLEVAIYNLIDIHKAGLYLRWKWHFENHDVARDSTCFAEFIEEANNFLKKYE